jgi:release factor glutamine methyltransferase
METWNIAKTLDWTTQYLGRYMVPDARCDAEVLLADVLDCRRGVLGVRRDDIVPTDRLSLFKQMIIRRARRDPVAYILGYTEFMGLRFNVNEHTLIPRPETELLVDEAMRLISTLQPDAGKPAGHATVADMGTGSGCIAISIAKLSAGACVYASDVSKEALSVAGKNAVLNGVSGAVMLCHGDMFKPFERDGLNHAFDMIVSNPPYVLSDDINGLEPELFCEPRSALDGGSDGLQFYRQLATSGFRFLKPNGYMVLEINAQKAVQTADIFSAAGYTVMKIAKDYSHLDRIMTVKSTVH